MPPAKSTRIYAIPVEWTAFGTLNIEAHSLAVAVELAETLPLPPCEESEEFRVRMEVIEDSARHQASPSNSPSGANQRLWPEDLAWLGVVWSPDMAPHTREDTELVRSRLLFYLRRYPFVQLSHDELAQAAGTPKIVRHIRRLRRREGWPLTNGRTVREMEASGEWNLDNLDIGSFANNDYVLLTETPDPLAAARWHKARRIRQAGGRASDRLLAFLKNYVGQTISNEELRCVAGKKWARRVRELRTEYGWPIKTRNSDRRDLPVGTYVLESLEQLPEHDRQIPDDVQVAVLIRDGYACRKCGWQRPDLTPHDPRYSLDLHHLQLHSKGGGNTVANLLTLCNVHHKQVHREAMDAAQVRAWLLLPPA